MSELNEINEDNCVLSDLDLWVIEESFGIAKAKYETIGCTQLIKAQLIMFQKITRLNEMAKELYTRNLSVKSIIKFYEIGKQAQEQKK